MTLLYP